MRSPSDKRYVLIVLICIALALLTLAAYWPIRAFQFLNYDDPEYVTANGVVREGLTWHGLVWALTAGYASNWHPVTWLSHMLDCQIFGMNPKGPHWENVLFHIGNTLLLFGLFRRVTDSLWTAGLVAL